ncbi:hypothetical protein [Pleionea sp. CnH1-48]|uniref:hypothetical protein n=1 Tax=Pleionea sp. CnH1-48 TaxID=2954494 RepID=UPI00209719B9|nr:hypothetical protein [Pleionea sp. CnH1-48]MCO7225216.1 hypothetical protein [Pleionea sp. CnH1-48]
MKQFVTFIKKTSVCFAAVLTVAGCLNTDIFPSNVQSIASEYRELKSAKGHYNGGQWRDELDKWKGKKHELMSQLADYINQSSISRTRLTELMGEPDEWRNNLAVYYWRGHHDYLLVQCSPECNKTNWFYSYE